MTKEQKLICSLLAKALFQKEIPAEEASFEEVYEECIRQTILAVVVSVIPKEAPLSVRMKWINAAGVHAVSNRRVEEGHVLIHRLLSEHQIPYVLLKGLATASYYPDPDMRSLGDVDFLIREEDAARCDRILKETGFFAEENTLPYEWGYQKNNLEYELHLTVNGVPEGETKEITETYLSDLIETAVLSDRFSGEMMLPDAFHHGLVILLHTAKHMVGEGVGFRQISDWAVFAATMGESFPELFEEPMKKIGIWNYARILSAVCVKYIGMPRFSWIPDYEDGLLEDLMEDLLRKGNFRREEGSGVDSILVEKTDVGGVASGSMTGQLFRNLGQKAKYKWPVMNRAKVLIPFGVCVMCAQYTGGMLTGKYKKIKPKELVGEAQKRRKLYEELELFSGGSDR